MKSSKKKSNRVVKFISRTFVSVAYILGGSICPGWWGEEDCPKELIK